MIAIRANLPLKLALACALVAAGGLFAVGLTARDGCAAGRPDPSCARVLFVGNSYIFSNDLPAVFAELARAGGRQVETAMVAEGGWTLADHARARQTGDAIEARPWRYVVLQEQSQIPSVAGLRDAQMAPAARALAARIRAAGATPLFLLTWARRDGWPEQRLPDYGRMQDAITRGYLTIAEELDAPVAPAGEAWRRALRTEPAEALWQPDGSHPGAQGTYLAACVLYATVFGASPEGLRYTAGLPGATAQRMQAIAAAVVLEHPDAWNLPASATPSTSRAAARSDAEAFFP